MLSKLKGKPATSECSAYTETQFICRALFKSRNGFLSPLYLFGKVLSRARKGPFVNQQPSHFLIDWTLVSFLRAIYRDSAHPRHTRRCSRELTWFPYTSAIKTHQGALQRKSSSLRRKLKIRALFSKPVSTRTLETCGRKAG